VSSADESEALEAIAGGADIVDVKNPKEGALGAVFPWIIRRIIEITPEPLEVSCTLGDLPNLPGSVTLAALGVASTGVDYVKCGLIGVKTYEEAVYLLRNVSRAVKESNPSAKVVAVGFADADRIGTVSPFLIPKISKAGEAQIAMLDTALKDGKSLLAFLTTTQLKKFVDESHAYGLGTALAGSLKERDLSMINATGTDIVGVRSAACTCQDRVNGHITRKRVNELAHIVKASPSEQRLNPEE